MPAQNTTGGISGVIKNMAGEAIEGANIKAIHEPSGTLYLSQSKKLGYFEMSNMNPGGPYTMIISCLNYSTEQKSDIYISLGESLPCNFVLSLQVNILKGITVFTNSKIPDYVKKSSLETIINANQIGRFPSLGSNLYDFVKVVPQSTSIMGTEGAISFAGQNNRYNAFYIDGAIQNDIFGLAASGTNGGQASISPISLDAIEQIQVLISPYDASIGNFTGAGMNAITRSGSNKSLQSFYHFLSTEAMTGKTPTGLKENAEKFLNLSRTTKGFSCSGPIIKNTLFFYLNAEMQREQHSQPFEMSEYMGNTKELNTLFILSNTLKGTYKYDPGIFLSSTEKINTDRVVSRIDWNINHRHKFSFSSRYVKAERTFTNHSDPNTIHFTNNGYRLYSTTQSASIELKSKIGRQGSNKLLITYTDVWDDRAPLGKSFPRVRINDGDGAIIFGSDNSSTINLLTQKNWTLYDRYHFIKGKHSLAFGIDLGYNQISNAFIQNSFGSYTYSSIRNFLTNASPSGYQIGFSNIDNKNNDQTNATTNLSFLKTSIFCTDEIRMGQHVNMIYGIRIDSHHFLNQPQNDSFMNHKAIPTLSTYWNLDETTIGTVSKIPLSISPRIGFRFKWPGKLIILRGGMGIFTGRIPLAWPGGAYSNNGQMIGGYSATASQLNQIRFRSDPSTQWKPMALGATMNKVPVNLNSSEIKMPSLFRTTLGFDKRINTEWSTSIELIYSKNLQEINYRNINIIPPSEKSLGPDKRSVYSIINNGKIPLLADGSNPYDYVILFSNHTEEKGHAYSATLTVSKQTGHQINFEACYTYGHSTVNHEGTASINISQWRLMETVNGRNYLERSQSDFSSGHRIFIWGSQSFQLFDKNKLTSFTITYQGQSGSTVSYVYENSMTRDDGIFGGYDLVYIPSKTDMTDMVFLPNIINGITYTIDQQKEAFDRYIEKDSYLKTRRGMYVERNGSRSPFTHVVSVKINQDFNLLIAKRKINLKLFFDIFNVTNLINRNWGRQYNQPNKQIPLLTFAGYESELNLIPQYRFNPALITTQPWVVSASISPAYSARWSGQIGIKLNL